MTLGALTSDVGRNISREGSFKWDFSKVFSLH